MSLSHGLATIRNVSKALCKPILETSACPVKTVHPVRRSMDASSENRERSPPVSGSFHDMQFIGRHVTDNHACLHMVDRSAENLFFRTGGSSISARIAGGLR